MSRKAVKLAAMWLQKISTKRRPKFMRDEDVAALKSALKRELPDIPLSVRFDKKRGSVNIKPTKKIGYALDKDQATRVFDFLVSRGMSSAIGSAGSETDREKAWLMFSSGFDYWTLFEDAVEAPKAAPEPVPKVMSKPSGVSGIAAELVQRMGSLLDGGEYDVEKAKQLGSWVAHTFRVELPRTPRGQKELKKDVNSLIWNLKNGGLERERTVRIIWEKIVPQLGNLVRYFTDEGGTTIPREVKTTQATYLNKVGLDEKKLKAYTDRLDALFASVKGWRRGAFKGGLVVSLSGPKAFRGTAGGVYKSGEDTLYVRATPKVLQREAGSYGSIDYILVHELGHRYEWKNSVSVDFERPEWWTTKYSREDGEAFAELFAMGNWPSVSRAPLVVTPEEMAIRLARFEKLM